MTLLFVKPYFNQKMWGGQKLHELYGYDLPTDEPYGEAWVVSGHSHGQGIITGDQYDGQKLGELYKEKPALFGNLKSKEYPLLVKILDAEDNLSVQVHPDDDYAAKHENDLGKTESWLVLSAEPGADIVYGHNAKSKEELERMVENGEWNDLLRKVKVQAGDFFYVPSGTIHGLNAGVVILETQQSSDTTYRLYDYDRVDAKTGQPRQLHIAQSLDTTTVPFNADKVTPKVEQNGDAKITTYVTYPQSKFFSVARYDVDGHYELSLDDNPFLQVTALDGNGTITDTQGQKHDIQKGESFVMANDEKAIQIDGTISLIVSAPIEK